MCQVDVAHTSTAVDKRYPTTVLSAHDEAFCYTKISTDTIATATAEYPFLVDRKDHIWRDF